MFVCSFGLDLGWGVGMCGHGGGGGGWGRSCVCFVFCVHVCVCVCACARTHACSISPGSTDSNSTAPSLQASPHRQTDLDPGQELERVAVHEGAGEDGAALGLAAVEGEAVDEHGEGDARGSGCGGCGDRLVDWVSFTRPRKWVGVSVDGAVVHGPSGFTHSYTHDA